MDSIENLSNFYTNISFTFPTNLTFDEYIFDNSALRIGLYVIYTAVFVLCFFGNLAVVIVVTFHWRMRTATKFCMGNLAFANLCVAIFCIFQNLSTFLRDTWIFGRLLCKMYHFTNSLSHSASTLILVVICGERYLSIVHPLRCRGMLTIQRLRVTIAGVWLLSGLISSPRLFYISTFKVPIPVGHDGHYDVICAPQRTLYDSRTADLIYFVVLFLLPLLVLCVLYTKIARVLWRSSTMLRAPLPLTTFRATTRSKKGAEEDCSNPTVLEMTPPAPQQSSVNDEPSGSTVASSSTVIISTRKRTGESMNMRGHREHHNPSNDSERKWRICPNKCQGSDESIIENGEEEVPPEVVSRPRSGQAPESRRAAIRMLIVIVVTFVVCNLPYHIRKICQYSMGNDAWWSSYNQFLTPVTFLLMYTNCAINPILYFFMSKDFRSSLRELLKCRRARKHSREVRYASGRVTF